VLTGVRERARDDSGLIAVWFAVLVPVLFAFAAFAVDVSRWYVETERMQKAADAAALAGVVYMPADFARARATARDIAARNGFPNSGRYVVDVTPGDKPSRLKVTITSTIDNVFGAFPVISQPTKTLSRSATADFAGPVPMGSPCNLFGNEPNPATGTSADRPTTSVASANCALGRTPNFWANVAGPDSPKANGDRYTARNCTTGNSFCNGRNVDYYGGAYTDPFTGLPSQVPAQPYYFYKISVTAPVSSISVQIFDPAFIDVGDHCEKNLGSAANTWPGADSPNPFVNDARTRYAYGDRTNRPDRQQQPYCTGDNSFNATAAPAAITVTSKARSSRGVATLTTGSSHDFRVGDVVIVSGVDASFNGTQTVTAVNNNSTTFSYSSPGSRLNATTVSPRGSVVLAALPALQSAVTTSVAVHSPTDTLDPLRAPVIATCVKQYPGFQGVDLTRALVSSDPYYLQSPSGFPGSQPYIAKYFRQWSTVCTINAPQIGDYYLQVRRSPREASSVRMANPLEDSSATGSGHNRFAVRTVVNGGDAASVATAALERMPIYANLQGGTTQFYIARVGTPSAGSTLTVDFFDTGDASDVGQISIVRPSDASGDAVVNCRAVGEVVGGPTAPTTLNDCTLRNIQSSNGYNGRLQRLEIPIPDNYACDDASLAGCCPRTYLQQQCGGPGHHDVGASWTATRCA
jgi:Flp pilus assembly protein TadG